MPEIHRRCISPDDTVGGSQDRDRPAVWSRDDRVPVFRAAAERVRFA